MKLEKWALVAEILSAVAIVISLIFVGLQIRQGAAETALNTRAIETSAFQNLTAQINGLSALVIENPQFAELRSRVMVQGLDPESPQEEQQIRALFNSIFRHGELAFLQFENELVAEDDLNGMLGPVRLVLRTRFGSEHWEALKRVRSLNSRYMAYIDASIGDWRESSD